MNLYYFGSAFNLASLYMLAGLGACVAIKSGEFNLGGEGQIYAGGFVAAVVLVKLQSLPGVAAVPLAFLCAFLISAFIALISALLKQYKNADFLFTSFIASSAVIPIIDGFVAGPFRGKTGNLLATPFIADKFQFNSILPPSTCNLSFPVSIILCVLGFLFLYRTSYGRKICIFGVSKEFALYSGYNQMEITYGAAILSGGLHGICGAAAICGTYYTCHSGFYAGMGWNALSAALIAFANPLLLLPSSVVLAFIITYANKFGLYHNFGFDISSIIQAAILFLIAIFVCRNRDESKKLL